VAVKYQIKATLKEHCKSNEVSAKVLRIEIG
jgi:hypothetical protein